MNARVSLFVWVKQGVKIRDVNCTERYSKSQDKLDKG